MITGYLRQGFDIRSSVCHSSDTADTFADPSAKPLCIHYRCGWKSMPVPWSKSNTEKLATAGQTDV